MQILPLIQEFTVSYKYPVYFTHNAFDISNDSLFNTLVQQRSELTPKTLVFIDEGVAKAHPLLISQVEKYIAHHSDKLTATTSPIIITGGEDCKNQPELVDLIEKAVNDFKIDRHSYIIAIGGGAFLDLVGFAAAISHRGVRLVRVPTTVLSQNDSGIGVKNSVNAFKKKNFLGTFAPPYAVINDSNFLTTLDDRNWRAGIAEAIKVALIKDKEFFHFLKNNTRSFASREMGPMEKQIFRCAQLHLQHIASGDPFEMGSSRPLDFGHWSAHKLEQLTNFSILHGEAVAIGIALDCIYSYQVGMLSKPELEEIITCISELGFPLFHEKLESDLKEPDHNKSLFKGLSEFREHLGGKLTIMLLEQIGKGKEVHEIDLELMAKSISMLKNYAEKAGNSFNSN